jgi:hypothetical protein
MWDNDNTWLRYLKNIIAADVASAVFLATYLRQVNVGMAYASCFEAMDLNKYKIIRSTKKVKAALIEHKNTPFVFFVGKN